MPWSIFRSEIRVGACHGCRLGWNDALPAEEPYRLIMWLPDFDRLELRYCDYSQGQGERERGGKENLKKKVTI